jgi:biopolymer transport protein ExbB
MLFVDIVTYGGPVMWLIVFCSFVALIIILERWFHLHRAQINVGELLNGLINVIKRGNLMEAITLCEETPGPVSHVLRSVILRYAQNEKNLKQAATNASLDEVPRMERRMNIIATIAYIAPLLGLLGTVLGMIDAFQVIQAKGAFVNAVGLSEAVWQALLTTAAGLCVAIPCHIAYNYLVSRIQTIVLDIDKASSEIIYFFSTHDIKSISKNRDKL